MQYIETEHGIFTNNSVTEQTAEEVYQEWLINKDKPPQKSELELTQENVSSLGTQLVQSKISNMQKDSLIKSLGTQITQSKLQDVQAKSINNALGRQLVQSKITIIKLKGGI